MNERIKRLIEQATTKGEWSCVNNRYMEEFDKEKFAELIVRECAKVGDSGDPLQDGGIGRMIKERFGIEE
jgi:hypothetical protein